MNDLAHGEFGKWLESVQLSKSQANRFIKVYKENESGKLPHVGNIACRVLYEIATLPEPERTKEHVTSKGETKTPDEMTVKGLYFINILILLSQLMLAIRLLMG